MSGEMSMMERFRRAGKAMIDTGAKTMLKVCYDIGVWYIYFVRVFLCCVQFDLLLILSETLPP